MEKIIYTIGSNNTTKELEKEKIISIIANYYYGFTTTECEGFWKWERERSLKVEVSVENYDDDEVKTICSELCFKLGQDAVMVECTKPNVYFLS